MPLLTVFTRAQIKKHTPHVVGKDVVYRLSATWEYKVPLKILTPGHQEREKNNKTTVKYT